MDPVLTDAVVADIRLLIASIGSYDHEGGEELDRLVDAGDRLGQWLTDSGFATPSWGEPSVDP